MQKAAMASRDVSVDIIRFFRGHRHARKGAARSLSPKTGSRMLETYRYAAPIHNRVSKNMKNMLHVFAAVPVLLTCLATQAQVEYVDPAMGGQGFMLEPTRPTV